MGTSILSTTTRMKRSGTLVLRVLVVAYALALHAELLLGAGLLPDTHLHPPERSVVRLRTRNSRRRGDLGTATAHQVADEKLEARAVHPTEIQYKPPCQFCHCKKVYVDVGTNIGIQIRKLYEPSRFPGAQATEFFDKYFGQNRSDVCAIGFEPNPNLASELNQIQDTYTTMGYNVMLHTRTAVVADDDGVAGFHLTGIHEEFTGLGSSFIPNARTNNFNKKTAVRTMNLVRFIKENISPDATILMKLDIEGAEFTVFPQMLLSGVLCDYIDFIFIEWHDLKKGFVNSPIAKGLQPGPEPHNPERGWNHKEIELFVRAAIAADPKCNTVLSDVDDESFHMMTLQKMPLPELVVDY